MSKSRVCIAALLFLAATCLKFALPMRGAQLCSSLRELTGRGMEMRQAAAMLGESIAAFRWTAQDAVEAAASSADVPEADSTADAVVPTAPPAKADTLSIPAPTFQTPVQAVSLLYAGHAPSAEAVEQCAEELAAKAKQEQSAQLVEAFLAAQSAFTSREMPADVCCAAPELGIAFASPISGLRSSGFGYRLHPVSGEVKFHYGTDFAADAGTEIGCFADGTVTMVGEDAGYGKYILVDHGNCSSLYAHCSAILVSAGEGVSKGQIIGKVGQTGLATGPHLHFELRQDGLHLNPEFYCGSEG